MEISVRSRLPSAKLANRMTAASPPLLILLSLFLAGVVHAQILTNGGFESSLTGWSTNVLGGGVATFADTMSDVHSGTNALLITVAGAGSDTNSIQLVSSSFAANSSDTYVLRFWASTSVLRSSLGINLLGATPNFPQIPFQISTNDDSYQEYLYAFRASGKISIAFNFQTVGKYWLDDVEVLDLTNNDGWDIPMTYLWQWGQLNYSKTNNLGWGGGDNDKSAVLPDGSVVWIFNDTLTMSLEGTFFTNVRGDASLPRNSVVHQVGTNLYWLNNGNSTFFVPTNSDNLYWIGGCQVETNNLLVLLNEINATAITNVGISVAFLSLPGLTLNGITQVTSPGTDNYGTFINGGDGYYYIYNGPQVARTPVGSLAVSAAWTYWDGSAWVTNHTQATDLPNLADPWSVAQLGPSNFVSVYMPELSLDIMAQFAPSPMGPWSDPVFLYATADQWDELNYAPNICAGTGGNGRYTIGYSDDGSPEGLAKWASDKSFYNPHFVTADLYDLSPYSVSPPTAGPGARLSLKFAADKDYGYDAIGGTSGAGPLNTSNWFNVYGPDGASNGVTAVPFYTLNGLPKFTSGTKLVYNYTAEINSINTDTELRGNVALLDSFIRANSGWYLSVTNLDAVFTNGYSLYFYFNGGVVGRGGQNYVRYYDGQTTNTAVLGLRQWNLYTTATNDGQFIQDLTPANTSASGETPGANYIVFTNLSGGAFDLLITNGNYGGLNGLEIVANPLATTSRLTTSTSVAPFGTTTTLTNVVTPPPLNGEPVIFMDGAIVLGTASLTGGAANFSYSAFSAGTHSLTAVYAGDADYLASTSSIVTLVVSDPPPITVNFTLIGNFAFQLSWDSLPQQVYQVEYCTNLAAGVWLTNTTVQASGTATSATVIKTSGSQEFFRVTGSY